MSKSRITWLMKEIPSISRIANLTSEQEQKLLCHYKNELSQANSPLPTILAILGSLLVGLGVILIFATNWRFLTVPMKVILSIIPFAAASGFAGTGMAKRWNSAGFRESAGMLTLLTFAAAVALVSQAYHTGGSLQQFLTLILTVSVPLLYLFNSYSVALLLIIGMTWLPFTSHRWWWHAGNSIAYIPFFLSLLPFLIEKYRREKESAPFAALLWGVTISLLFTPFLSIIERLFHNENVLLLYGTLGVTLLSLDSLLYRHRSSGWDTPFRTVGKMTLLILYITCSYNGIFDEFSSLETPLPNVLLLALSSILPVILIVKKEYETVPFIAPAILIFATSLFPGGAPLFTFLMNAGLIALGIFSMKSGVEQLMLRRVNFGFFMIAAVILLRFVDIEISFTLKGVLFILMGTAFLLTNIKLSKKRKKSHEK